jgi:hypothetical protein
VAAHPAITITIQKEHGMGDKGGKKDKDKLEKQKAKKKDDKAKAAEKKRPKSSKPG